MRLRTATMCAVLCLFVTVAVGQTSSQPGLIKGWFSRSRAGSQNGGYQAGAQVQSSGTGRASAGTGWSRTQQYSSQQPASSHWSQPQPKSYSFSSSAHSTSHRTVQSYGRNTVPSYESSSPRQHTGLRGLFSRRNAPSVASAPRVTGPEMTGRASWYGRDFHGGPTANGERYDMYSMTAAHRTLPFGTKLKVTNLDNGRECVVRVNNRGPFRKGRVLDLSKGAAQHLGMISSGIAKIKMQVLAEN